MSAWVRALGLLVVVTGTIMATRLVVADDVDVRTFLVSLSLFQVAAGAALVFAPDLRHWLEARRAAHYGEAAA